MTTEKLPPEEIEEDYEYDTLTNERLLKDHEYDGIRELDNSPPFWFNMLFIATIVFAFFYMYILFMFKPAGLVQEKEFEREMARVHGEQTAGPSGGYRIAQQEIFQVLLLTDERSMENGSQIYKNSCAVCHLDDGGGMVGPNLTDNYWVHGNSIDDLYRVVTEGVVEKGMIPYRNQLSENQRLEVSSFILGSLAGSQPANPKGPEGILYE